MYFLMECIRFRKAHLPLLMEFGKERKTHSIDLQARTAANKFHILMSQRQEDTYKYNTNITLLLHKYAMNL